MILQCRSAKIQEYAILGVNLLLAVSLPKHELLNSATETQ